MVIEKEGKLGELIGRRPSRAFTVFGLTLMSCLVVIAWVLFIKYSL